jgi:predicted phosphate transport protein (TIGR00153 family)
MMFRSIFGMFGTSPFVPMIEHSELVLQTSRKVPTLFEAFFDGDYERVHALSAEISELEYEADKVKTRVREALPRSLMLPVDRRDVLEALSSLDGIADCAEDVGILFTLRRMEAHDELIGPLKSLVRRVMATVEKACEVVSHLETLSRAGFTGSNVDRVIDMIDEIGRLEHEADLVQDDLARRLFAIEDDIAPGSLIIWNKIFNKVGDMANHAERLGNRLRLFFVS